MADPQQQAVAHNNHVYIHEFINITGHNRANYVHHMTANWSPGAQERRGQRCYGVWSVIGSTGEWPQVINMWEEDGWDGLANSFEHEAIGNGAQDPILERWWAAAAGFRSGGSDRIMVPMPWSAPIETLCANGVRGAAYAHELVTVDRGHAGELCDAARTEGADALNKFGWQLVGGFTTAMRNDDEALLIWALPNWSDWGRAERALASPQPAGSPPDPIRRWRASVDAMHPRRWHRTLMVDAPLSPMRTGRQPRFSDQIDWSENG